MKNKKSLVTENFERLVTTKSAKIFVDIINQMDREQLEYLCYMFKGGIDYLLETVGCLF